LAKWGLAYKGTEILSPEEWNRVVDALNELDKRAPLGIKGGRVVMKSGTSRVTVTHGLNAVPSSIVCTGTHSEVKAPWVENPTTTSFDIVVEAPVTADREIYWIAILI